MTILIGTFYNSVLKLPFAASPPVSGEPMASVIETDDGGGTYVIGWRYNTFTGVWTAPDGAEINLLKRGMLDAVNARTDQLIEAATFVYSATTFSLSPLSINSYRQQYLASRTSGDTYPVSMDANGMLTKLDLANVADVEAFFNAGSVAIRAIIDPGETLKTSIRAAATVAALSAITDTR